MGLVLGGIIIVFLVAAGILYAANSREVSKQEEVTDEITRNQAILSKGVAEKKAKEAEAATLAEQLASAKQLLEQTHFLASAESIEYDRILFSIANSSGLRVTSLTATPPSVKKENSITYQVTIFTVNLEGRTPGTLFSTIQDSTNYITSVVDNILAFINTVTTTTDFDTALIQSVNISTPEPMTAEEIGDMLESIKDSIRGDLTDAETEGKTDDEIDQLVNAKLAAKSPSEIQLLLEQAGLDRPSAVITIEIWTYKGA
jgi:hypothetical protein